MATPEAERQQRDALTQTLNEIAEITPSQLSRSELTPDLNFAGGVIYFDRIIRLFKGLRDSDLTDIPYNKLVALFQNASSAMTVLVEARDFSISRYPNNPIAQRDSIISRARDQYDGWFEVVAPIVAFTVRKGVDFERLENQARENLARIVSVSADCDTKLQAAINDSEQALAQVRAVAQEAGVSQHAFHFKMEAESNERTARPWLFAAMSLAATTVVIGGILIAANVFRIPAMSPSQSIQMAIPKLFVLSVFFSATVWCGKTYRAHRHNAVVNRHRQNALATFQTFAKAASDQATKDAVLLQATQCIFSQQPTGYIHSEPEPTVLPISEMIRAASK